MKKTIQIENFSKGFNTSKHPQELDDDEFAVMENLDLKRYGSMGKVAKRYPIVRYNSNQFNSASKSIMSMYEYRKQSNSTNYLLVNNSDTSSSQIRTITEGTGYTGAYSVSSIKTAADVAYKLQFTTLKDRVYIANYGGGAVANQTWDGTNFLEMGCPPCNNKGITGTPETVGANTYFYWITFLYDGFQESGVLAQITGGLSDEFSGFQSPGGGTISTTSGVTIASIPTGNARVTARKIYRGLINDSSYAYYIATINDNTTTTYTDRLPEGNLGEQIDPVALTEINKPYKSKYVCSHKDRLYSAYLQDNEYTPLVETTDVTFTPSDTGGNLGTGVYKYRLYKAWLVNDKITRLSRPLDKTIDMTALGYSGVDNSVTIAVTSTVTGNGWYNFIIILRTKVGGSEYFSTSTTNFYKPGKFIDEFPLTDTTIDTGLFATWLQISEPINYQLSYTSWVAFSDASKPDLFPSGNIMKIGQDDSDAITGIWSVEDRIIVFKSKSIHEIDTTAVHPDFWRTNKIVDGIGADAGAQVLANDTFYFVSTTSITKNKFAVYEWSGRGEPQPIDYPIRKYVADLNTNGTIVFKDIAFDKINNRIIILIDDTTRSPANQFIFQYDLDLRKWQPVIYNGDMKLNCIGVTRDYGVLYGLNTGYLNYQKPNPTSSEFKDDVNGNLTEFTTKLKTKTFTVPDGDLRPREVRGLIETDIASGTLTLALKTCSDNGTEYSANMMVTAAGSTTLVDGINRVRTTNFNTVDKDTPHRTVYFSLEEANNMDLVYHNLNIDLRVEHQGARGK